MHVMMKTVKIRAPLFKSNFGGMPWLPFVEPR